MREMVLNVFNIKRQYEASRMLADLVFADSIKKQSIISLGGSENVDSVYVEYKAAVQEIKKHKHDFLIHYNEINTPSLKDDRPQTHFVYNFHDPLSSFIDKDNMMTYPDRLKIIKHFIIDLDRDTLPSLAEARQFLDNKDK